MTLYELIEKRIKQRRTNFNQIALAVGVTRRGLINGLQSERIAWATLKLVCAELELPLKTLQGI